MNIFLLLFEIEEWRKTMQLENQYGCIQVFHAPYNTIMYLSLANFLSSNMI